MSEVDLGRDTVAIDEAVHDIYKQLTEGNDPLSVPFRTMKDVFMWAACLGYQRGERRPLAGKRVTIFRWAQFLPQLDVPLLKALAIAECEDTGVLLSQEDVIAIAEEFANCGIHELRSVVLLQQGQPIWNLVGLTSSQYL